MNQREIKRWNLHFRLPLNNERILAGHTYWKYALFTLVFSAGILSIAEWVVPPPLGSMSITETEVFVPTAMPTAFPTAMPTAFPTAMPTEAPPEPIKPSGPLQPVPLPPRPANLSLVGSGFIVVVCMLALVIVVLISGYTKQGFHFLNKWYSH